MAAASPLIAAVGRGDVDRVRELIAARTDLNAVTSGRVESGLTPLIIACKHGHFQIAELLVAARVDIEMADSGGSTPLLFACEFGHREIAELLLAKGVGIDNANRNGRTPLMIASENGYREVVDMLVAAGADIEKATYSGITALMLACEHGHRGVVETLVAGGADLERMYNGHTALSFACFFRVNPKPYTKKGPHREVALLLLANGAQPTDKARKEAKKHSGLFTTAPIEKLFTEPLPAAEAEAARAGVRAARAWLDDRRGRLAVLSDSLPEEEAADDTSDDAADDE